MKKLLLITLMISVQMTAHAAEGFSTLEERMSGKEFVATGLSKLSEEELAELNDWIRRHSVATLDNATARPATTGAVAGQISRAEDDRGFENRVKPGADPGDDTIHANIAGTFTGWKGSDNLFTLTNGMVWQQIESSSFTVKATENAEITIKKGFFGSWGLSMVGYNKSVKVRRIK